MQWLEPFQQTIFVAALNSAERPQGSAATTATILDFRSINALYRITGKKYNHDFTLAEALEIGRTLSRYRLEAAKNCGRYTIARIEKALAHFGVTLPAERDDDLKKTVFT